MRYLLAILCPPAIAMMMPGPRKKDIWAVVIASLVVALMLAASGLAGWIMMPFVMVLLWLWAGILACLDTSVFYREQKVQIITEAVQRAAHEPAKEPEAPAMKLPMPANYDPSRDVYKL